MKKSRKKCRFNLFKLPIVVFFTLSLLGSCNDDKQKENHVPSGEVIVDYFYPDSGRIAEKVIFTGNNFGTNPANIKVYFNQKQGKVIGSDGNSMYVVVPRMPGDTCKVAVVIGNDSIICDQTFRYKTSVTVSTVCGNGEATFKEGTLSSAQLRPRFLCVDSDGNIFAIQRDDGTNGLIRINEEENIVTLAQGGLSTPNAPCVDLITGVVTIPADEPATLFYNADPGEGWAVRSRTIKFNNPTLANLLMGSWDKYKHSMAVSKWDGYIYTRYRSGYLVKINPKTFEGESVLNDSNNNPISLGGAGDCHGVAFHPQKPSLLYMSFTSECGDMAHAIYSIDVAAENPISTLKRLSAPGAGSGGFRDGKFEQAMFKNPRQIYFDPDGYLYIADYDNHCIRRVTPDNMVETVVGIPGTSGYKDGNKDDALFNHPWGLGVSKEGNVYIADFDNKRIRKLAVE